MSQPAPILESSRFSLQAATVRRRLDARRLEVVLADGRVATARVALGVPYRPARKDEVVVVGGAEVFVIGVLSGRGRLVLDASKLHLRVAGRLRLSARRVAMRAQRVDWRAGRRLRVRATELITESHHLDEWVTGATRLVTRQADQLVRGKLLGQAKAIVWRVADAFHVNGDMVRLG